MMEIIIDRRHDDDLRAVINQALEFKKTLGQGIAMSYLAEHYVPSPLLERVLTQPNTPAGVPKL